MRVVYTIALTCICLQGPITFAADYYWDANGSTPGTGGTGNWGGTNLNWRTGSDTGTLVSWSDGNAAVFSGTAGTATIGNSSTFSASYLKFNTAGYTLSISSGSSLSVSNSISSDSLGFRKTGGGTLTLNGSSGSFSGDLLLNGGRINFNNSHAAGTGEITIGLSTTAFVGNSGTVNLANSVVLLSGANPLIYATDGNSLELSGPISGLGGFRRDNTGAGTLMLSGSNSFEGGFALESRGVTLGSRNALGTGVFTIGNETTAPANAITIQSNSSLTSTNSVENTVTINQDFTVAGTQAIEFSGEVSLAASKTWTISNTASTIFSGAITGDGFGINKSGTGTLTLAGSNSYTGPTTISNGTISASNVVNISTAASNIGHITSGPVVLGGASTKGTLSYTGNSPLRVYPGSFA